MSAIRFTIQDYTSGSLVSTIVDEPIGFDKVQFHINRDKQYHGFADMIDDSLGIPQFYGPAREILKAAYDTYGVNAHLECLIEYACSGNTNYEFMYQGRFKMETFDQFEGINGCYVEVAIVNNYDLTIFRNRIDQDVSLDSIQAFDEFEDDGVTPYPPLTPYAALGVNIELQPMLVRQLDYATVDTPVIGSQIFAVDDTGATSGATPGLQPTPSTGAGDNVMFFDTSGGAPFSGSPEQNEFNLQLAAYNGSNPDADVVINPFTNVSAQEIITFPGPVGEIYESASISINYTGFGSLMGAVPIFTFQPDIPYATNAIQIDIELSWAIFSGSPDGIGFDKQKVEFILAKGQTFDDMKANLLTLANTDGTPGGKQINNTGAFTGTTFATVSGATIDNFQFTGLELGNDVYAGTPGIQSFNHQYSFHGKVWFNPGDQLYLLVNLQNSTSGSMLSDLQFVFYSDTYTFRNSYLPSMSYPGTGTIYTLSKTVVSSITSTMPLGGGTYGQYRRNIVLLGNIDTTLHPNQPQSYVRLTFNSFYSPTEAPVYLINEALSRITEIITDGNMRVYSDYFGRTDAQPYTSGSDGAGSLTAITNGLLIRGYSPIEAYRMGYVSFRLYAISSGASTYTLNLTDEPIAAPPAVVLVTNTSGTTVIIPTNATVAYPIGYQLLIEQGTGVATVQGASGVTIYAPAGLYHTTKTGEQLLLTKVGTDIWLLAGRSSMSVSFRKLIDALNCVHTAGFTMLPDPHRSGRFMIQVEPIAHFYDSGTVMLTCENVDNVQTLCDHENIISKIDIGYSKWEAEQAQGLDEFNTKRSYRTTLNTVRNAWDKLCSFIGSGYAIETTRRKLGTNTTDWRYDKDNFIICVERSGGGFKSEQGGFTTTPAPSNMIDPASVYNARISPVRNLLRWLRWILPSYPNPATGQMIFMSGEGNYYASGEMASNPIEAGPLHENQILMQSDYVTATNIVYKNELVKFKYPLGYEQWSSIYNQKTGLIKYNVNGGAWRYGYVQELQYDWKAGMGEFTLKTAVI